MNEYIINIRLAVKTDLNSLTDIYNSVINEGNFTADLDPVTIND